MFENMANTHTGVVPLLYLYPIKKKGVTYENEQ